MTNDTFKIEIALDVMNGKYSNITDKEAFYSSPEYHRAYNMWRKSKHGDMDNDLLMGLVEGGIKGAFSAIRAAMRKPLDRLNKTVRKMIDSVVRDYTRSQPGVTFKE